MAFKEAERTQLYLRCALFGPSGSGKTKTALRMAKGIADKMGVRFAVIDTEARSASKYAGPFKFIVDDLENKTIEGYLASMEAAKEAGYKVLVIDSLSHAWRELTEEVDRIALKSESKNKFSPWALANPKQKRLIDAILNFPGHLIVTMRSKTEWVIGEKNGRKVPEKVGLAPEQGKGIEYEFDLLVELNQRHQAVIVKDRTGGFQDEVIDKPGEEFGEALYEWLNTGTAMPPIQEAHAEKEEEKEMPRETASGKSATKSQPSVDSAVRKQREKIITEITAVITAVAKSGAGHFTETEKADARKIILEAGFNENGLNTLEELKGYLSDELANRQAQRKAA